MQWALSREFGRLEELSEDARGLFTTSCGFLRQDTLITSNGFSPPRSINGYWLAVSIGKKLDPPSFGQGSSQ